MSSLRGLLPLGLKQFLRRFALDLAERLEGGGAWVRRLVRDERNSVQAFRVALESGRLYFGWQMASAQGVAIRHGYMDALVEIECQSATSPYQVREVGSWAGSSALTWAQAIRRASAAGGSVTCIDPWRELPEDPGESTGRMRSALRQNKIFPLFLHNVRESRISYE